MKQLVHSEQPFASETPISISISTPISIPISIQTLKPLETTLDSIRNSLQEQPPAEIYKLLVQKGFTFDSYQTRFDGTWSRQSEWSVNVKAYLMAHGLSPIKAEQEARRPYHQGFQRNTVTEQGIVFTIDTDHGRRVQTYHLGNWTEPINDTNANVTNNIMSVLYAGKGSSVLQRNTVWQIGRAHV